MRARESPAGYRNRGGDNVNQAARAERARKTEAKGKALAAQLGIPDAAVVRAAGRVYDDVQAQMNGVEDGERRIVADNTKSVTVEEQASTSGVQPQREANAQPRFELTGNVTPKQRAIYDRMVQDAGGADVSAKRTESLAPLKQETDKQEPVVSFEGASPETKTAERSFPRTLKANNLNGGDDRTYTPTSNRESVEAARKVISERGVDGAFDYVKNTERLSAEHTVTGIELMNRLQREADAIRTTRPEEAEAKFGRAAELAEDLSRKLTEAGQTVQAASIVSRLSPDGILLYAQRQIAKYNPEARVTPEQAQTLTVAAKRVANADAGNEQSIRIAELAEKAKAEGMLTADERTEIRDYIKTLQGAAGATPRQTATQILTVRLDTIEQAAQARLKARGYQLNTGIPADVIADYSALYAARLAKGAIKAVDWAAQVARDYGADVQPILARIEREALRLLNTERARARSIYKDAQTMSAVLGKIEEVKAASRVRA